MSGNSDRAFPEQGLLPKGETEADVFLARHPTFDGRNALIAIFDTGCDPGAANLQTTSDGQRKFVDFIDASGSGDVSTSTMVHATAEATPNGTTTRFVSPLSGRSIIIPGSVKNPRALWHIGVKKAYELYPAPLVDRMRKERKRLFDEQQRKLEQALSVRLARWDEDAKNAAASPSTTSSSSASSTSPSSSSSSNSSSAAYPSTFGAKDKADLEARLAEVKAVSSKYNDEGPIYDVIAWHVGTPAEPSATADIVDREVGWFVMVDSSESGDFRSAKALTNYRDCGEYATFGGVDLMNYTVNIYNSGKVVSIVTTAGSHGTHVAGIAGASAKEVTHNGIAPGARMLSIKIGDSRLGSMETGVGIARGLIEAIRYKADIINMSYGEASSIANSGRLSELIRSAVFDHGIIFVSSHGNNGPALSTSGTPGGTDSGVISVGAYVSPNMSLACYSSRKAVVENQYTWSSRGPTLDGATGCTFSACGGAVTSVCEWQLQKNQLMNGTSMSSPAAAGGIALLVSGLKGSGVKYTPHRVRNAIECTARSVAGLDPLSIGAGVFQIEKAFTHLLANANRPELDLFYKVSVPATNGRGIYLRDPLEATKPFETSVSIEAVFRDLRIDGEAENEEKKSKDAEEDVPAGVAHPANYRLNKSRVQFEQKIALVPSTQNNCSAALARAIDAPSHLFLMHGGRTVTVVVHAELLPPGPHYTELLGYDSSVAEEEWASRGPLFRVPITVLKPEDPAVAHNAVVAQQIQLGANADAILGKEGSLYRFNNLQMNTGVIHRKFVVVPEGASYVDVTITMHSLQPSPSFNPNASGASSSDKSSDASGQQEPDPNRAFEFHAVYLQPETAFRAHESATYFVLSNESNRKEIRMDVRAGQTLEACFAQYWSSIGACAVDISLEFGGLVLENQDEIVLDAAEAFKPLHFRSVIRATKLNPAASIKTWNQLVKPSSAVIAPLTKERDLLVLGHRLISSLILSYNFDLKEDSSAVKFRAYPLNERLYESVFEAQMTQVFDQSRKFYYATDAFEDGKSLKAGKYIVKIQVRHEDGALLERLKDMSLVAEIALGKAMDLPIYASYSTAVSGGAKFGGNKVLKAGKNSILYVGVPDAKSFPSFAKPGDWGSGQLTVVKTEGGSSDKAAPVRVRIYAPAAAAEKDKPSTTTSTIITTASSKKAEEKKDEAKPAEPEQDPQLPKLEQKDNEGDANVGTTATATGPSQSPAPDATASDASSSDSKISLPAPSTLEIELRDLTIEYLNKFKGGDSSADNKKKEEALRTTISQLLAQFPSHLPLLLVELRFLHELNQTGSNRGSKDKDVLEKARKLRTVHIDQTALLAHFGRLIEKDDTAAQGVRKEKEDMKKILIKSFIIELETLAALAFGVTGSEINTNPNASIGTTNANSSLSLLFEYERTHRGDSHIQEAVSSFQTVLTELSGWLDLTGKEAKKQLGSLLNLNYKFKKQYGLLWKQINSDLAALNQTDASNLSQVRQVVQEKMELLEYLAAHDPNPALFQHLLQYERDQLVVRFPKDFRPF